MEVLIKDRAPGKSSISDKENKYNTNGNQKNSESYLEYVDIYYFS